jgi:hypothetical protein
VQPRKGRKTVVSQKSVAGEDCAADFQGVTVVFTVSSSVSAHFVGQCEAN